MRVRRRRPELRAIALNANGPKFGEIAARATINSGTTSSYGFRRRAANGAADWECPRSACAGRSSGLSWRRVSGITRRRDRFPRAPATVESGRRAVYEYTTRHKCGSNFAFSRGHFWRAGTDMRTWLFAIIMAFLYRQH